MNNANKSCSSCEHQKDCCPTKFEVQVINEKDELGTLWEKLKKQTGEKGRCVYRGQLSCYPLTTTLERALRKAQGVGHIDPVQVEKNMTREFQRWYAGQNEQAVSQSLLYCLSLMQHHGAPSRLLDWTYSPYVALYFGLQDAYDSFTKDRCRPFALWAINDRQCWAQAEEAFKKEALKRKANGKDLEVEHYKTCERRNCEVYKGAETINLFRDREKDECRTCDTSFKSLYWADPQISFVCPENAYRFHSRLYSQQGVFLCTGDISQGFEDNLLSITGDENRAGIIKYCFNWNQDKLQKYLDKLRRMNIYRATLFPGLDGFGRSLVYRVNYFNNPASWVEPT